MERIVVALVVIRDFFKTQKKKKSYISEFFKSFQPKRQQTWECLYTRLKSQETYLGNWMRNVNHEPLVKLPPIAP